MSDTSRPLGLTQRLSQTPPVNERRDSLARDWYPFMKALGRPWLPLPNDPATALDLAGRLDLGGLILTGGEDFGQYPERDETETALLDWASERRRPVIGVCRGFQFICRWLGGEVLPVKGHVAVRHEIISGGRSRMVNSYHKLSPVPGGLMEEVARCPRDGTLEAARRGNLLGLLWHPEREETVQKEDIGLFLEHLKR